MRTGVTSSLTTRGRSVSARASQRGLRTPLTAAMTAVLCLFTAAAHANGRLPGATGLAIHPSDGNQLLLGLTYGLALTRDHGSTWTWMCEQQIEGNGSSVDPAMVMTNNGTLVVLSLTNGGVLVSRNDGCTFERALGPLEGHRGTDLALDPSQPSRVLALMSSIIEVVDAGYPRFDNFIAHSLDHGGSWDVLAELPDDMLAETVEIAPSDPNRIYVSGTSSADPLQGIVERSDDGGRSWTRHTVRLPTGSGSLFVSAVHPSDPDRLWFRVPGRGDIYGVLPARLWLSTDGAATFNQVADTQAGMLGFAVSPEGDRVVFGGPTDGLFMAPADASTPPTKISDQSVSCLRWHSSGLYMCTLEPGSPYSLGFATDPTQGFVPVWRRADTCREACAPPSTLEMKCQAPWNMIAPLVGAQAAVCGVSSSIPDAGMDAGRPIDASTMTPQPTAAGGARAKSGCTVALSPNMGTPWWMTLLPAFARSTRKRRSS